MSYGFKAINQSNEIVIDSGFQNHRLVASGSASATRFTDWYPYWYQHTITFTTKTKVPLLFVQPGTIQVGNCYTALDKMVFFSYQEGTAASINYKLFDLAELSESFSTGYGLGVKDENGRVVFDSDENYLDVKDYVVIEESDTYNPFSSGTNFLTAYPANTTKNHISVSNAYYMISGIKSDIIWSFYNPNVPGGVSSVWSHAMIKQSSATQIALEWGTYRSLPVGASMLEPRDLPIIVIS